MLLMLLPPRALFFIYFAYYIWDGIMKRIPAYFMYNLHTSGGKMILECIFLRFQTTYVLHIIKMNNSPCFHCADAKKNQDTMFITPSPSCAYVIITMISLPFLVGGKDKENGRKAYFLAFYLIQFQRKCDKKIFVFQRGGKLLYKLFFYKKHIKMIENANDYFKFF